MHINDKNKLEKCLILIGRLKTLCYSYGNYSWEILHGWQFYLKIYGYFLSHTFNSVMTKWNLLITQQRDEVTRVNL